MEGVELSLQKQENTTTQQYTAFPICAYSKEIHLAGKKATKFKNFRYIVAKIICRTSPLAFT